MQSVKKTNSKLKLRQKQKTVPTKSGLSLSTAASVTAPVAKGNRVKSHKPSIMVNGGRTTVKHREILPDLFGSNNWSTVAYPIQPGSSVTFPWLSQMAALFESYKFLKLEFEYQTQTSTATVGRVLMAADYDSLDASPTSKQQFMSYENAVSCQPWDNITFQCKTTSLHKLGPQKYIRTATVPNSDIKTYDCGNFYIASVGVAPVTAPIGELYVSYIIELNTPQYDPTVYASFGSNRSTAGPLNVGCSQTNFLGTSPALNIAGSGMDITYNAGTYRFGTVGQYLVSFLIPTTASAGGAPVLTFTGSSVAGGVSAVGSASLLSLVFTVNVVSTFDVLTISGLTFTAGTAPLVSMRVASYPYLL